ncbi:MAG TPA: pyruvate kinase [Candidatus Blautia pullistercoris]|uniref:Pyruvate kinase n=1 Tax=Candidatus Blautia pullistercoris TaxID=2838499 RepID=A0A9D1VJJ5_9FIRM|nr:pyruvate kinase [Candidatus Blautia pullistercoris]
MRSTKIICTMGPNTDKKTVMKSLVKNGMNVARFNFSHGDHEEQRERMNLLKNVREELDRPVAILLDTKGPEIRTGLLEGGKEVTLKEGSEFILYTEEMTGNATGCCVTYPGLAKDVKAGDRILIDDGLIELKVKQIKSGNIVCHVENGGELGERKGVNVPNVKVKLPAVTEKDIDDILFGIQQDIDFIAASFIRSAKGVKEIRKILKENHAEHISIIAKIENAEGVENIDEIIEASDGIMVARGDLGVEIPAQEVPHIQKMIIKKCNERYVPVITATQMLDSMIRNPRPTRAEVADVANAIYDGTDAVMLSGETAAGKYPIEALKMMNEIAENTEQYVDYEKYIHHRTMYEQSKISSAIGIASVRTARNIGAACIVTPTMSGKTARLISNFRPSMPIYAVTPNEMVQHKMQLYWGVIPLKGYIKDTTENIIVNAMETIKRKRLVRKGQTVVITAGDPATNNTKAEGRVTNMLHVLEVV